MLHGESDEVHRPLVSTRSPACASPPFALALAFVATLGMIVPSVSAAAGDPKVVIIVGATHGATAGYRADADVAYAEARKYTSNVIKVYSPNATWAKVKAAVVGASIVIYMGHGNGWPSPYTYDPTVHDQGRLRPERDGRGRATTTTSTTASRTWRAWTSRPARSCSSITCATRRATPSQATPSRASRSPASAPTTTPQGFLKAGASAVIADGHAGAESYLRALFTTHRSIEDMWRSMPNRNGNVVKFASMRTPGVSVFQDPVTPTSGF